jgi:hypothetical protein
MFGIVGAVRPGFAQEAAVPVELETCEAGVGETLDGVVIDRATRVPLAGAQVWLSAADGTRNTVANAAGRFRFCGVPPTLARVSAVSSAVRSPSRRAVGGNRGQPLVIDIDLGEPASVAVTVVDEDTGRPVNGVTIRLQPGPISGVTNEAGRLGLGLVPPGDYRLLADHLAFESFDAPVFIVSDEPHELQLALETRAIALEPLNVEIEGGDCAKQGFTSVSGRVIDRRTKLPLSGALVSASRYAGDDGFVGLRAEADDDGLFILCGLPVDKRVRLEASLRKRFSPAKFVSVQPGGEGIVLEIDHGEPGFVALHVVDASTGASVAGAMIRLHPLPLGGLSGEQGRASLREVPPGRYEVRVDHIAYASFDGILEVGNRAAEEFEIPLQPTAIAMEPLEVKITGRDPYLLGTGFYDRMATLDEGEFYDYWDIEPYYSLATFTMFKDFIRSDVDVIIDFVNGRPLSRLLQSLGEIPFGKVRGVELIRCADLPQDMARWIDDFAIMEARQNAGHFGCYARLIWRGERRVRSEREKPTDRCAMERKAELVCAEEGSDAGGGDESDREGPPPMTG